MRKIYFTVFAILCTILLSSSRPVITASSGGNRDNSISESNIDSCHKNGTDIFRGTQISLYGPMVASITMVVAPASLLNSIRQTVDVKKEFS